MQKRPCCWQLYPGIFLFQFGVLCVFVLYFAVLFVDYQIALQIAKILFTNNVDDGFAISRVKIMSSPISVYNMIFCFIMLVCFMRGILGASNWLMNPGLHTNRTNTYHNKVSVESKIELIFLSVVCCFPIALIQTEYSVHFRLSFVLLIQYFSFCIAYLVPVNFTPMSTSVSVDR